METYFTIAALLLASFLSVSTKPGICPKGLPFMIPIAAQCFRDEDCPEDRKCCRFLCTAPISIKPQCPKPEMGTCVEECSSDEDCLHPQQCCFNGCGHQCTGPKPGSCGRDASTYVCHNLCAGDYDCPGMKKCCPHQCGRYCKEPFLFEATH